MPVRLLPLRWRVFRLAATVGLLVATATAGRVVQAGSGPAAGAAASGAPDRPTGARTLYLIRHGQYTSDSAETGPGLGLTPLGREEAGFVAARLRSLPGPIDSLFCSPLTRARETAGIIREQGLPGLDPVLVPDLAECTPPTWRRDIMATVTAGEADSCRLQLDRAFARFFRPSPERDVREVLVCHGNVIRYLVCRTLGVDSMAWLGMMIGHCSLTVIRVQPDGTPRLVAYGDMGHLPPGKQTFLNVPRAAATPGR